MHTKLEIFRYKSHILLYENGSDIPSVQSQKCITDETYPRHDEIKKSRSFIFKMVVRLTQAHYMKNEQH